MDHHHHHQLIIIEDNLELMLAIEAAIATACEARDRYAVLLEMVDNDEIDFSEIVVEGEGEDDDDEVEDNNNHNNIIIIIN